MFAQNTYLFIFYLFIFYLFIFSPLMYNHATSSQLYYKYLQYLERLHAKYAQSAKQLNWIWEILPGKRRTRTLCYHYLPNPIRLSAGWGMRTIKKVQDVKKNLNVTLKVRLNYRDRRLEEGLKDLITGTWAWFVRIESTSFMNCSKFQLLFYLSNKEESLLHANCSYCEKEATQVFLNSFNLYSCLSTLIKASLSSVLKTALSNFPRSLS